LPRTVLADERVHLAGVQRERHLVQRARAEELLGALDQLECRRVH
jgi:hypothetical protein